MKIKSSFKYFILPSFLIMVVLFTSDGTPENADKKKKLYISSINAEGLSKSIANRVREGLSLAIFENYGREYHVLDDDAIRIMYKQAEKILASGCTDYSCMTQIADGINADEIIYGVVRREGPKIRLVLSNLQRNRKTLSIGTKSKVSIFFPESQLDHYAAESAMKLMNSSYRIRSAKVSIEEGISLSSIKVEKVEGLDISVMKFTSSDDIISRMLGYLKGIVEKGDENFKDGDYSDARSEYSLALERIRTKLLPDQQKKMVVFVTGVKKRIASSYVMETKGDIEKIDRDLESGKKGDISVLENFVKRYTSVNKRLNSVPWEIREYMGTLINAVKDRMDSIYIAIVSILEKKADTAYREYQFENAIAHYRKAVQIAEKIGNSTSRIKHKNRIDNKLKTAKKTAESYLSNRVKSLLELASFYNLKDETDNALDAMSRARSLIEKSSVATRDICKQYNSYTKVIKTDKIFLKKKIGGIEFVYIPGGTFMMGSNHYSDDEKPVHRVTVDSFWMGRFEVTQKQYEAIIGSNPSYFKGFFGDTKINHPVVQVSWNDAMEFCKRFSSKYGVKARLPYEAEWEYACRAGTTTIYYWGDSVNGDYCWYHDNSGRKTHPVGKKKPNAWGLYDMSGNVSEWCMDWFDGSYYKNNPAENPRGPSSGEYRVFRGGSFYDYYFDHLRNSERNWNNPNVRYTNSGFRVVIPAGD